MSKHAEAKFEVVPEKNIYPFTWFSSSTTPSIKDALRRDRHGDPRNRARQPQGLRGPGGIAWQVEPGSLLWNISPAFDQVSAEPLQFQRPGHGEAGDPAAHYQYFHPVTRSVL